MTVPPTAVPVPPLSLTLDRQAREALRQQDVEKARDTLTGAHATPMEMYALAERLQGSNEFGYARRLYRRIRLQTDYGALKVTPVKVGQRHALCTYKDPDLPARERFKRALQILDQVELMIQTPEQRQESLGLRGAVYKRLWQSEGQLADLERALAYYLKGYEIGPEKDQGYTGINAAFVLDLLARQEAEQARCAGTRSLVAGDWCGRARAIRQELVTLLPALVTRPGNEWLGQAWWYYTTLAEAHFGLGDFPAALAALRGFNAARNLRHSKPPVDAVQPWELESVVTQLATLTELQADLAELLGSQSGLAWQWPAPPDVLRLNARSTLREYLGPLAPGLDRAVKGKVGLALSGGGFRASLFHIGVLAHLSERDILRHVEALSCVSGGSIVGAQYYLEVKRLLEEKKDGDIDREDYLTLVEKLASDFLAGVQRNIRCRAYSSFWANLRTFFQPGYTTTRRLGALYERELYSRVQDRPPEERQAPRLLKDLFVHPQEDPGFKPKYDNWRRAAKVPILVLNATTLNSGHNWQFTGSWMGEPPTSIDSEIEAAYRLRRMYHHQAPRLRDRWRNRFAKPFGPPDYQQFRLGEAVAASSCVPGLFEPLVLPDLYDKKTVRLVDGGVFDNQGIASLLEQDCTLMILSDASGQMGAQDHPSASRIGVPLRSFSVSMARVRQAQYRELASRRRAGLLKGFVFLHLTKDLKSDPVDWRECKDHIDCAEEWEPGQAQSTLTSYGIPKEVQRRLSEIRTDLDSFTEVEAFALMTSGYHQARVDCGKLEGFPDRVRPAAGWRFLQIEPVLQTGPGYDELLRELKAGAMIGGKVWQLWRPLRVARGVLAIAALLIALRAWWAYYDRPLWSVGALGLTLILLLITMVLPRLGPVIQFRQPLREVGLRGVLAALLALGLKLHLWMFDPLFLKLGRLDRLLKLRGPGS